MRLYTEYAIQWTEGTDTVTATYDGTMRVEAIRFWRKKREAKTKGLTFRQRSVREFLLDPDAKPKATEFKGSGGGL